MFSCKHLSLSVGVAIDMKKWYDIHHSPLTTLTLTSNEDSPQRLEAVTI